MQIFAIVVSLAIAAVGIALFVKAIREIIATVRIGQPTVGRSADKPARWGNMLKEPRGATRQREARAPTRRLQWSVVGIGHCFVFIGFGLLFFTLVTAFGQLFDAHFALPLIGHFFLFEWASELFTVLMLIAIVAFIGYRASRPRQRERGPKG